MWDLLFDGFDWAVRHVNRFQSHHWIICFAILLTIGFLCMRGLGARGAR